MSDPYQQVEKELELTKRVLENLDKNTKLSILTKSNLILRDLKLLKQFKNLEVGFTINDFEGKTKDLMEPFAPSYNLRLEALKTLNKEGIKTYVFVSPIVPGLIDLKTVINNTKQYSDHY
jgi:DNA repair photolyase